MNKKIKCDIYTRVSTTMQVDGYSLDAQKEKLKRYAEFQNMEIAAYRLSMQALLRLNPQIAKPNSVAAGTRVRVQ